MAQHATEKVRSASCEDGDGGQLENDTCDHYIGSRFGACVLVRFGRSNATADGLDDEGDHIAGAEDPEIHGGTEDGGVASEDLNKTPQKHIYTGREECRC